MHPQQTGCVGAKGSSEPRPWCRQKQSEGGVVFSFRRSCAVQVACPVMVEEVLALEAGDAGDWHLFGRE